MSCCHSKKDSFSIVLPLSGKEQSEDEDGDTQANGKARIDAYKGKGKERKSFLNVAHPLLKATNVVPYFQGQGP